MFNSLPLICKHIRNYVMYLKGEILDMVWRLITVWDKSIFVLRLPVSLAFANDWDDLSWTDRRSTAHLFQIINVA